MFDLGFGNSRCIRRAFLNECDMVVFTPDVLYNFDYPKEEGDPELIEITKKVIKRQIGKEYRHVLLTNGATGAVTITLRAYAQKGATTCVTRNPPYYTRYPIMIDAAGLGHNGEDSVQSETDTVILLDLPSNPLGLARDMHRQRAVPVILDGVYLNKVYTDSKIELPLHNVFVGSYSKLTGLNGLRIGWIATDDGLLYERLKVLVMAEYSGIDKAGTEMLKKMLPYVDWETFEDTARSSLDYNRGEWSKLEKYFQGIPVSKYGMFSYQPIDKKCDELLKKSGIMWTPGSLMGASDSHGRFNLGQSEKTIRDAVKNFIKVDTIK